MINALYRIERYNVVPPIFKEKRMVRFIVGLIGVAIAGLLFLSGAHANAEMRMDGGDNKTIYFDQSGKKLSPIEANRKGQAGETILACKNQDYVCNERTGKCVLKNAR